MQTAHSDMSPHASFFITLFEHLVCPAARKPF